MNQLTLKKDQLMTLQNLNYSLITKADTVLLLTMLSNYQQQTEN